MSDEAKGWLVEEAVRHAHSKIWHHARYGTTDGYHVTWCGRRVFTSGWIDAHAVPKKARCKRCDWSGL